MFKLKPILAALSCICLFQTAHSAEFVTAVSPTTVELQKAAIDAPQEAQVAQLKDAETQANEWLTNNRRTQGAGEVVHPDGTREYVGIYIGVYEQYANDKTISTVRSLGGTIAQLDAKAKLISEITKLVNAEVGSVLPQRTPVQTEYDKKVDQVTQQLNSLMKDLAEAQKELDSEKANQIAQINQDELIVQGIAQTLANHGITLEIGKAQSDSANRIKELQSRIASLDAMLVEVEKEQKKLVESLTEQQESTFSALSKMVVMGAVPVNSFESVINGRYQCAVVVVWSTAQERFIRNVLGAFGTNPSELKLKPTTGKEFVDYVNNIKWESVNGGRWIVDNNGIPHLLAVGVEEITDDKVITKKRARIKAKADANLNLALSLQADMLAQTIAQARIQGFEQSAQTAQAVAEGMKAEVKDLQLTGVKTVLEQVRTSPLTGRKVYVHVVEYSPTSRRAAKAMLDAQIKNAQEVGRAQQQLKGYIDESRVQIEEARRDANAYAQGAETARNVSMQQQQPQQQSGAPAAKQSEVQYGASATNGKLSNSSFGGEGAEDFQF